jgi:hypothetical protein
MGPVMFLLVPFCAGFAIAMVTRQPNTDWAAMLLAALITLALLVAFKFEGLLCAVLAFPVLGVGLYAGAGLGHLFRRHVVERLRHQITSVTVVFALTPALILMGHHAELPALETVRREIVSDSIFLQASQEEVWANIQSIDSIDARKPLLMHFGLPVPLRCTLERKGVGAKAHLLFRKRVHSGNYNGVVHTLLDAANHRSYEYARSTLARVRNGRVRPSSRWKRDSADSDYDYHVASLSRLVLALFREAGSVLGA